MPDKFEDLVRAVYRKWRQGSPQADSGHPDEEALACFLEGRLAPEENERIKAHLLSCEDCAEGFGLNAKLAAAEMREMPQELLEYAKGLVSAGAPSLLEIALRLKEKMLEIINTTGDILVGQELVPAPVLRSRAIKDFKDEVTILKDFQDIRVEVKIENKDRGAFNLIVLVKQKQTQQVIKDLRVALFKEEVELESYLTESGAVTFEHVLLGSYKVEVSAVDSRLASVLLDIKT